MAGSPLVLRMLPISRDWVMLVKYNPFVTDNNGCYMVLAYICKET